MNNITFPEIENSTFHVIQAELVPPDACIRLIDKQTRFFITDAGLRILPGARPPENEVQHCMAWIRLHARPRKTINFDAHSYVLKHVCENWEYQGAAWPDPGGYCSNGSFILAAIRLGFKIQSVGNETSPNACFNMKFNKVRTRRYEIRDYRFSFLPWDELELWVLEYSESHHARGLFPLHVSSKKKSDRRGAGPGCWKVIASGTENEMFAMLETKAKEMGVR